jgi:hypothetical protein
MSFINDIEERGLDHAVRAHQVEIDFAAARKRAAEERAIAIRAFTRAATHGARNAMARLGRWLALAADGLRRNNAPPARLG